MSYNLGFGNGGPCDSNGYGDYYYRFKFYFGREDTIVVYCIIPFATLSIIFNFYFFCRFPKARQPPFDILLFLTIFSILTTIVYLSTNIYNGQNPIKQPNLNEPDSLIQFCKATGIINFISQFGSTTYNAIFCIYYTWKLKNPLKSFAGSNKQIHILCLVLIAIVTVVFNAVQQIGFSALGVCGLKIGQIPIYTQLSLFGLYFLVLSTSSIIFLRSLHKISQTDPRLKSFFKYFLIYTTLLSIVYFIRFVINIFLSLYCTGKYNSLSIQALAMIGNISVLIKPLLITTILCFHPQFSKQILQKIAQYCKGRKIQPMFTRQSYLDKLISYKQIQLTQYKKQQGPIVQQGYLQSYNQTNKINLISTILGCISLMNSQKKYIQKTIQQQPTHQYSQQNLFSWNYHDKYEVQVNEQIMKQCTNHFIQQHSIQKLKFIAYSVHAFQQLMLLDHIDSFQQSVNPHHNIQKIKDNVQMDGGKSGQFFLFTYDNMVLLKTITQNQLNILLDKLQQYYKYLKNHPQSLIVKIYGVFTAINLQTLQQYHFMMMINLCQNIHKKHLLRLYDCKGSTHQRQVFKLDQQQQAEVTRKTMKDVDFQRLQTKIWVNKQNANNLKRILKNDSQFFCANGLIDYSLIIIKMNYTDYCKDLDNKKPTFNTRTMFQSEKQSHVVYILGIIDYLQTWNVKKRGQRFWKSIFTKKTAISSQSPAFYSQRFCKNLIDKIFE